jgi:hypothetical protein
MKNPNQTEKRDLIEQALQEAVSGGAALNCSISCHIFSINVCYIDLCGEPGICASRSR